MKGKLAVGVALAMVATSAMAMPTNPWVVNKFLQVMAAAFGAIF